MSKIKRKRQKNYDKEKKKVKRSTIKRKWGKEEECKNTSERKHIRESEREWKKLKKKQRKQNEKESGKSKNELKRQKKSGIKNKEKKSKYHLQQ